MVSLRFGLGVCFGFFSILVVLYRLALLWLSLGEPDWSVVWFGLLGVVFGLGLGSTGLISMFSIILNLSSHEIALVWMWTVTTSWWFHEESILSITIPSVYTLRDINSLYLMVYPCLNILNICFALVLAPRAPGRNSPGQRGAQGLERPPFCAAQGGETGDLAPSPDVSQLSWEDGGHAPDEPEKCPHTPWICQVPSTSAPVGSANAIPTVGSQGCRKASIGSR